MTTRASVSRVAKAQPSTVFGIVCDPKMQVEIDGSGIDWGL
jgi:hypothetical protein